jgi:hypothetical protein
MRPPSFWNFCASRRNSMISLSSSFFYARHVLERDLFLLHRQKPRPALPKRKRLVPASLHLADHEEPQGSKQNKRRQIQQPTRPASAAGIPDVNHNALIA